MHPEMQNPTLPDFSVQTLQEHWPYPGCLPPSLALIGNDECDVINDTAAKNTECSHSGESNRTSKNLC